MGTFAALFEPLQSAIARQNQELGHDSSHPWNTQLKVTESEGLLDVEYRGEFELLDDLLRLLASPTVAPCFRSFAYGTDAVLAANGTYTILIDSLIAGDQTFAKLSRFILDQGEGEHGYKILASALNGGDGWFEEAGILAELLTRAPALQELVTPSPPSDKFFLGPSHPLHSLNVDAGFGHADFIRHLTHCPRFPNLRHLVFTDFRQDYLDDWREQTTTLDDYAAFFASGVCSQLESVCLRAVNLTPGQIQSLLKVRSLGVEIVQNESGGGD